MIKNELSLFTCKCPACGYKCAGDKIKRHLTKHHKLSGCELRKTLDEVKLTKKTRPGFVPLNTGRETSQASKLIFLEMAGFFIMMCGL